MTDEIQNSWFAMLIEVLEEETINRIRRLGWRLKAKPFVHHSDYEAGVEAVFEHPDGRIVELNDSHCSCGSFAWGWENAEASRMSEADWFEKHYFGKAVIL